MIIGYFKKDLPNEKGETVNTIMLHITDPDAFELDLLEKLRNHTDKDIIKDVNDDEEIIIGKPDKEEEIVDIPVEKKRRGRPKKAETEPVIENKEETVAETAEEDHSKKDVETVIPSEEVTAIANRVIEKEKEALDKLPAEEAIADESVEKKAEPVEKTEEKPVEEKKEPPKKKGFVWKGIQ